MTSREAHLIAANAIADACRVPYGTDYANWPSEDFAAFAEHMMLSLDTMSDAELTARYRNEKDPEAAREEDRAYWISVVTDVKRA